MQREKLKVDTRERWPAIDQLLPIKDIRQLEPVCAAVIDAGCDEAARNADCDAALMQLFYDLECALSGQQDYQHAVLAASVCLPQQNQPWRFHSLIDTPMLRAGLLTLFRFAPIPLHDHPGTCGVQRLLSGRIRVSHYDRAADAGENQSVVWLDRTAVREFSAGASDCYHRDRGNLHELASISSRSVLLSMAIGPDSEQHRSWYFPVNGFMAAERGFFNRLKKPTRVGDRRMVERPASN